MSALIDAAEKERKKTDDLTTVRESLLALTPGDATVRKLTGTIMDTDGRSHSLGINVRDTSGSLVLDDTVVFAYKISDDGKPSLRVPLLEDGDASELPVSQPTWDEKMGAVAAILYEINPVDVIVDIPADS